MKNTHRGFAPLLVIAIVAVLAIGAGAYYYSTLPREVCCSPETREQLVDSTSKPISNPNVEPPIKQPEKPPVSTEISTCIKITKPGIYTLSKDLTNTQTGACISFDGIKDVTIDCKSHSITSQHEDYAIIVKNTQNFIIQNCTLNSVISKTERVQHMLRVESSSNGKVIGNRIGGNFVSVGSTSHVVFSANTITAQTQINESNNITFSKNTFTNPNGQGVLLGLSEGYQNTVADNMFDGQSDGIFRGGSGDSKGADDDIVIKNERNDVISGNTLNNTYDCGFETAGYMYDSKIINNKIDNAGVCGIGGWYYNSLKGNVFSGNVVTNAPTLFAFFREYNLLPKDTIMYFKDNIFESNTLISQRKDGVLYSNNSSVLNMRAPIGNPAFTEAQVVTGNNVIRNNNFGLLLDAPYLYPVSSIIDGGGNVCKPSTDPAYPISCKTQ